MSASAPRSLIAIATHGSQASRGIPDRGQYRLPRRRHRCRSRTRSRLWRGEPLGGLGTDINQRIGAGLRRVDPQGRVVEAKIDVGEATRSPLFRKGARSGLQAGAIERSSASIQRENAVVKTIPLGAAPTALAADIGGVWVAVE